MSDKKYHNESWLEQKYIEEDKTTYEIAEICDCADVTIGRWLDKFDIEKEHPRIKNPDANYNDEDWMCKKYVEEGLSSQEIADECGCTLSTVHYWLDQFDIDIKLDQEGRNLTPYLCNKGYYRVDCQCNGDKYTLLIHRLVAVAEFGYDAVVGKDVHHKNGITWDNRPENLELVTREEHTRKHNSGDKTLYRDESWLREKYLEEGLLQREIADICGCAPRTISYWLDKHDVDVQDHYNNEENFSADQRGEA